MLSRLRPWHWLVLIVAFVVVADLTASPKDRPPERLMDEATARIEFAVKGEEYGPDGITSGAIEDIRQVEPSIWCARIVTQYRRYDFERWRPLLDKWYCRHMWFEPRLEDGVYSSNVSDVVLERLRREGKLPQQ